MTMEECLLGKPNARWQDYASYSTYDSKVLAYSDIFVLLEVRIYKHNSQHLFYDINTCLSFYTYSI